MLASSPWGPSSWTSPSSQPSQLSQLCQPSQAQAQQRTQTATPTPTPRRSHSFPATVTTVTQPEIAIDRVLKRAEVSKIVLRLQHHLALAQFKTKHGWEDLSLDSLEPKLQHELRRPRPSGPYPGSLDPRSDSSSDTSESSDDSLPLPRSRPSYLGSSSPLTHSGSIFADTFVRGNNRPRGPHLGTDLNLAPAAGRKRSFAASFDLDPELDLNLDPKPVSATDRRLAVSSPLKRFRASSRDPRSSNALPAYAPASTPLFGLGTAPPAPPPAHITSHHKLVQSSPIRPRRHQKHFTTSSGPSLSFSRRPRRHRSSMILTSPPNLGSRESGDDLDDQSETQTINHRHGHNNLPGSSPPRTPPSTHSRYLSSLLDSDPSRLNHAGSSVANGGTDGASLLLYLATSPSAAVPSSSRTTVDHPPSTPPSRSGFGLGPPSSAFQFTPGQHFDLSEYIKFTPSPAPRSWKTPLAKTPLASARRRLTFD